MLVPRLIDPGQSVFFRGWGSIMWGVNYGPAGPSPKGQLWGGGVNEVPVDFFGGLGCGLAERQITLGGFLPPPAPLRMPKTKRFGLLRGCFFILVSSHKKAIWGKEMYFSEPNMN